MLKNILLMIITMLVIIGKADAGINSTQGLRAGGTFCPPSANLTTAGGALNLSVVAGACSLSSPGYVPASGNYSVLTVAYYNGGTQQSFQTSAAYIDAYKSINQQTITVSGGGGASIRLNNHSAIELCAFLVDSGGNKYQIPQVSCHSGGQNYPPLPPTPPIPDTSCTINNGSVLSVSLGTLERSEIPTAPDSTTAVNKTFPVKCTGGNVTVKMQMSYTPISIGSSQVVKTSANGVGTAIFYGSTALSPSDITSVTFLEGSNTLTLGFQAVRNSSVELKDIPTGAFTANAILVMTQQ